jgi:hypothetical protein
MTRSAGLAAAVALLAGTAMLAAPGQVRQDPIAPGTDRPGQATRGQVWIENRGRNESIPIVAPSPIPVIVENPVRQWEYQILTVTTGMTPVELTRVLSAQGSAGWETTGVQLVNGSNALLVMKRPLIQDARPAAR